MNAVDYLAGSWETSYGAMREDAGDNDFVPVLVQRGRDALYRVLCSSLFVQCFVLKRSVRPRVRVW